MAFFLIVSILKVMPLSGNSGLLFRPRNRAPGLFVCLFKGRTAPLPEDSNMYLQSSPRAPGSSVTSIFC